MYTGPLSSTKRSSSSSESSPPHSPIQQTATSQQPINSSTCEVEEKPQLVRSNSYIVLPLERMSISAEATSILPPLPARERRILDPNDPKSAQTFSKWNDPLLKQSEIIDVSSEQTGYPIPLSKPALPQAPLPNLNKKEVLNILARYLSFIKTGNTQALKLEIQSVIRLNNPEVANHFREMHNQMMSNRSKMEKIEEATLPLQQKYLAINDVNLRNQITTQLINEDKRLTSLEKKNEQLVSEFKIWLTQYEAPRIQSVIVDSNEQITSHHIAELPNTTPLRSISNKEAKRQQAIWKTANSELQRCVDRYEKAVKELASINVAMRTTHRNYQGEIKKYILIVEDAIGKIKNLIASLEGNQASGVLIDNTEAIIFDLNSIHAELISRSENNSLPENYKDVLLKLITALHELPRVEI